MVRFTSGRRSDFCETRSNFYHTLQGPYDDTVPGPEDFRHRMIFRGFLRLDLTSRRGTFAPPRGGVAPPLVALGLRILQRHHI